MPRRKRNLLEAGNKLASIRQFLQSLVEYDARFCEGKGGGIIDYSRLILEKGTPFLGSTPSSKFPDAKRWWTISRPQIKQCFYNSQLFALSCDQGTYYEGYAFTFFFPFHHAWVVLDGKVVDFTLEAVDLVERRDKIKPAGPDEVTAYLGVEIPTDALRKYVLKYKSAEPYAQMYHLGSKERFF